MPVPATTGQLRNQIEDMKIGDYIHGFYDKEANTWGAGAQRGSEYPLTGVPAASFVTGWFYFIKVDKGLLVADRVVQNSQSWDSLNGNSRVIQGRPEIFAGVKGILRSPTGGVAYADANGNRSLTDQGYGGWPTANEWDRYIVNFPINKIQVGKTLDDVFHYNSNAATWTQDTTTNNISRVDGTMQGGNTIRVYRGILSPETGLLSAFGFVGSSASSTRIGFRPVFEYKEV
ncbi:hypothetical protein EHV15_28430 [Paenibacillus oralis]|uniref:Uncharacterized protein n=1 Tax=Paenibacillus oralis TaxID=2490856 RepID=A0A3P3U7T2_9BACL|nr:hypothetical protein [Paenibacillus oralis]RRJ66411.1 hypothetical protein EHV15_28430 [Paenibacillus oralis]